MTPKNILKIQQLRHSVFDLESSIDYTEKNF